MSKRFAGVEVQLTKQDGNAFAVISRVEKAMRSAGFQPHEITAWRAEAYAVPGYNALLTKIMDEFEYR